MLSINELYSSVYEKLKAIQTNYLDAEKQLNASHAQDEVLRQKRIENLKVQLEKIEEYREKVEYFKHMAEKHIESKNLLTITPRELNFNRMRNWAMMIDPDESDDPYAQRIYVQAKCNEMFLDLKKEEFENTLYELENGTTEIDEELKASIEAMKKQMLEECRAVLEGEEFSQLATAVAESHSRNGDVAKLQTVLTEANTEDDYISFGIYAQPMAILDEMQYIAKAKMGDYYDLKNNRILLPAEHSLNKEMVFSIGCTASKEKHLYCGLQNYLLNLISKTEIGSRKIYFLDALHYNNTALGALKPLENSIAIEPIPRDSEQIIDTLKQIVSSFSDIDEALGLVDSVIEFNATAKPEERLDRLVLVLVGYPSAFPNEAKEYIKRILLNYEHYGITPILVDTQYMPKNDVNQADVPIEISENLFRIQMIKQKETIRLNAGTDYHFKWYELQQELSSTFVEEVKKHDVKASALGNEYAKRIDLEVMPEYERGKKHITLPYGIDSKDEIHSISFDNENFASYLMGASGSGKSTLLHTLITGIIHNYHPDDVELWLADFKMSEFAQYINPRPPHVKYILLDESAELVYDLIDKLTEKMMERQRFFMKHREMKKVENVPTNIYMPVIFVVLDEFSIMSQAIAESPQYKLKLQNLLAKGRALGIKFLFSSQTFLSGIGGLTTTAKAQIQSRIAMKNSKEEINETLELSSNLKTDQVKNWIDALPPHYALYKYRDGDALRIKRLHVMYFEGKGEEAFAPQRKIIKHINETMQPVKQEEYDPATLTTYVDKEPVIVDGNSYKAFNESKISKLVEKYKLENEEDLAVDDVVITYGSPRLMSSEKFSIVSNESRENILLVARNTELACGMSIVMSTMKSFEMQNGNVQVWAYSKNKLFKSYKEGHFIKYKVCEGMDSICGAIFELKNKIINKEAGNDLIVMVGIEQICNDFELIDYSNMTSSGFNTTKYDAKRFEATTKEEIETVAEVVELRVKFEREYDLEAMEDRWLDEGKSIEEIMEETENLYQKFLFEQGVVLSDETETSSVIEEENHEFALDEEASMGGAYNALEDFKYIVKQGSRFGYHFMLCLNDFSDIKMTKLQPDLFRHKFVFQVSNDDSIALFASKIASGLPEHICQYSDSIDQYSFRPFIHEGINWEGWDIDENGEAINSNLF